MKSKQIVFLTKEPFPYGMAATNRIISYCKGFIENGCYCTVLCLKPTEIDEYIYNYKISGNYKGINFIYTPNKTCKSKNFVIRRVENLLGIIRAIFKLIKLKFYNSEIIVINYTPYFSHALIFRIVTKLIRIKYIKEENEHPYIRTRNYKILKKIRRKLYIKFYYYLFDTVLLMTKNLIEFIKGHYKKISIIHVPMFVEFDRFDNFKKKNDEEYIAYCGDMNNIKDGVNVLIEAFKDFNLQFPNFKLYLIGNSSDKNLLSSYKQKIKELELTEKVIFTGRISRDEIPSYLVNAELLVLPRPNSVQAQHGFPTKLGEYLATGNPVIVTEVGEINHYLKDKKSAYLIKPGSVNELQKALTYAIKNKEDSKIIGKNGKKVAERYFNNVYQTRKILSKME
jgi:glycosyltransferase involved in cell wall biosynthesis